MKRHSKGFTLVELIIVIAVIGVLAAILIPVFADVISKANAKSALADARNAVSVYVAESLDRRVSGDTLCPDMITIFINKGGKWFIYGYDAAVSNSIMSSNVNDAGGLVANDIPDLINRYSWNVLRPGLNYDPHADQATLDAYTLDRDGAFYLQTYDTTNGNTANNPNVRGLFGDDSQAKYLRLDVEEGGFGLDLKLAGASNERAIFAGCLVGSSYTMIAADANHETPVTSYTITYDINLPAGLEATVNGNPVQASYTVDVGGEHTIQGNPVVVGDTNGDHVFDGWYEGSTLHTGVMSNVQENHALQAHWTHLQTVTVTLSTEFENLSHETANITYDQKYSGFGDGLTMQAREDFSLNTIVDALHVDESSIPSGMYFNGWMIKKGTADEYGYNSGNTQQVGTANVTIRPVIGPLQYTITFVADGNTVATFTKQWGQSVEFPTTNPESATNGHFKFWVYNEGHYTDSYPETITGDMEFTAEFGWYVVTFRGVLGEEIATTHTHDTYDIPDIGSLTATAGHHITGWTVSAGANPSTCPTTGTYTALTNNVTITATEDWNYYNVVYTDGHTPGYDAGTAGTVKAAQSVRDGQDATLPDSNPTWGLNTFAGWSRSNTNITGYAHNATVVIYALWNDPVTITYDKGAITESVQLVGGGAMQTEVQIAEGGDHLVQGNIESTVAGSDWVFDGWYDESNHQVTGLITGITEDMTITAHWTQLQYATLTLTTEFTDLNSTTQNISYSAKPGFTGLTMNAREDASLNDIIDALVVDPSSIPTGMYFSGWDVTRQGEATFTYDSSTILVVGTKNITITPVIGPINFTIKFMVGSTVHDEYTRTYGQYVAFPADPTTGFSGHFKAWEYGGVNYTNSYPNPINSDMTFTAVTGDYIVTFYDIDGSVIAATHTPDTDTYIVPDISELHPTAGHHITGWTVAPSGAPAVGAAGSTYTADRDNIRITATEDWNYYNVVYTDGHTTGYDSTSNPQGIVQVSGNNSQSVRHGQNATAPASNPTWGNYTFDHWSSNGQNITAGNHGDTVIIYAVWENPVTITYSKGAISENVVTVNDTAMQTSYEIVKGGDHVVQANLKSAVANSAWVFDGWEDESHNPVSGVLTGVTSDMTITATWTQLADVTATLTTSFQDLNNQTQNVTYSNLAGFSGSPLTQTVREGTNLNTIIDALVVNPSSIPAGMEHSGWEVNMGSGFASYDSSEAHVVGTSNITIKPIIGPLSFTVKFMNGSDTVKQDTYTWNQTITFPSAPASSAGNHFKGWDYGGTLYQNSYPNGVTGDMTFNASFGPFVVTFYNPNGTEITGVSRTADTYNIPTPTCTSGYHHTGWTVANGGANNTCPLTGTYTAVQDNVSITATEAPNNYTWTFTPGAGSGSNYVMSVTPGSNPTFPTESQSGFTAPSGKELDVWRDTTSYTDYAPGSNGLTADGDHTFMARWKDAAPSTYTITYTTGYGSDYTITGVTPGSTHDVLTMEEAGVKVGASKTGVLYWDCSNGTSYSPAGNYVASAGSSAAAAASMAHSVTVNSNLTFTAHTVVSGGTSDSLELYTFVFTPANGAGGTRTFVTGYKYRAASDGHTFVNPSAYGITAPAGKSFDHWQMTYRDYGDGLPTTTNFAVGATLATQRGMFFVPVYVDAPATKEITVTFNDTWNETSTTATVEVPADATSVTKAVADASPNKPSHWYSDAGPFSISGTTATVTGSRFVTTSAADTDTSVTYTDYAGSGKKYQLIYNFTGFDKINETASNLVSGKYYVLMADLDLSPYNFNPLGWKNNDSFACVLDGNGHTVSQMACQWYDTGSCVGLVATNDGVVKNIKVTVDESSGTQLVGGIAGRNNGTIANCYVEITTSGQIAAKQSFGGGIAGANMGGTITDCQVGSKNTAGSTEAIVAGVNTYVSYGGYNGVFVGGIAGVNTGTITRCKADGSCGSRLGVASECKSSNGYCTGGITGYNNGGTISECWAYNVDLNRYYTSISNASAVSGLQFIGGITGINKGTITNVWSRGVRITGFGNFGALIGRNLSGYSISNAWVYNGGGVYPSSSGTATQLNVADDIGSQQGSTSTIYGWGNALWRYTCATKKTNLTTSINSLPSNLWETNSNGPMLVNNRFTNITPTTNLAS